MSDKGWRIVLKDDDSFVISEYDIIRGDEWTEFKVDGVVSLRVRDGDIKFVYKL